MAKATGINISLVQRIWRKHACNRTGSASSSYPTTPTSL
jgi:hypothetical protein